MVPVIIKRNNIEGRNRRNNISVLRTDMGGNGIKVLWGISHTLKTTT